MPTDSGGKMENLLLAYIPPDRRLAMTCGQLLPERQDGAALFADISGFTPLTEALSRDFGAQRGAEELTFHLNRVYEALIGEVDRYRGSVVSFSGDAITCWFDAGDGQPSGRAVACAAGMQQVIRQLPPISTPSADQFTLAMKAAVATGSAHRFLVGDPEIQLIDTLAGALLDRLAHAEHHAGKGEILVDEATVEALDDSIQILEWRQDEGKERFALVGETQLKIESAPWPEVPPGSISEATASPWLLRPVSERLRGGQGEFLAELRPVVSFFLRFTGIDFEHDPAAGAKLDEYVRHVQRIVDKYQASLVQLTIGDKGSYLQAAFGAPFAHEDDAMRAFCAALELRSPQHEFIRQVQIGISRGRMRSGAYGGSTRRTYGVMSDDVNLAARLMQSALPGQILASKYTFKGSESDFSWEDLPDLQVKGKRALIQVASLLGEVEKSTLYLKENQYSLPMVGRRSELALIEGRIEQVRRGHGQILGVTGEAGMGKSRLVAEAVRLANASQLTGYAGECPSYGTHTSYLVWQGIWRSFFELGPEQSLDQQIKSLADRLDAIDSNLAPRLPLLGTVLNLPIPDNDLTGSLDAKVRKASLEALLVNCLRVKAQEGPLLLVLDDCQWIDPLSHDLLDSVGRAIQGLPILLLLAYRPPLAENLAAPKVSSLPYFTQLDLAEFSPEEATELVRLKARQLFASDEEVPQELADLIMARTGGNPFYIEELLNYVRDRGVVLRNAEGLAQLDLPASLHSLILSRIDQLSENQKITLKVASVIGRLFKAAMLWGAYPQVGAPQRVISDLDQLVQHDLVALDAPEPEMAYFFKHILTQEVAYESLPFATRSMLHGHIGNYIERAYSGSLDQYIDLLAFHFDRSPNERKRREYLLRAGESAQNKYANSAAIDYYRRLLPLLPSQERGEILLKLGKVLELVGHWSEAGEQYQEALALADQMNDRYAWAWARTAQAELLRKQGMYQESVFRLLQAQDAFEELGDRAGVGQTLHYAGTVAAQQGDYATSRQLYEQSLAIRRELDDRPQIANLLNNLGILKRFNGEYEASRAFYEECLAIQRELGDKRGIAKGLNNLGNVALDQARLSEARGHLEEALVLLRQVGDPWEIANGLNNLGNVARSQADYSAAAELYLESLEIYAQYEDKRALAYLFEDMGCLAASQRRPEHALRLVNFAANLRRSIGSPLSRDEQEKLDRSMGPALQDLSQDQQAVLISESSAWTLQQAIQYCKQDSLYQALGRR